MNRPNAELDFTDDVLSGQTRRKIKHDEQHKV